MVKNCRTRLQLLLFLVGCSVCAGADDDLVAPDVKAVQAKPIPVRKAAGVRVLNQDRLQTDLEDELRIKVEELRTNYELSKAQQAKLSLAGRGDINRAARELTQFRRAVHLQNTHVHLFGPNSFMAKVIPRIFTADQLSKYQADVDDQLRLRHRSNIEGAIRELERHVVIQTVQHEALVELMLCELPAPRVGHDFDSMLVRLQLSKLPTEFLKPVFDDDQWLKVRQVLTDFESFSRVLKQQGMIAEDDVANATVIPRVEASEKPNARDLSDADKE